MAPGMTEIHSLLCDSVRRPSEAPGTRRYTVLADFQPVRETHLLLSVLSLGITCYQSAQLGSDTLRAAVRAAHGCVFPNSCVGCQEFLSQNKGCEELKDLCVPKVVSSVRPLVTRCFNVGTPEKHCS